MTEFTNVPTLPCFWMAEHNQSTSLPDNVLVLKDGKCWVWGWRCCWEKVSGLQSLRCTQLNAENFCWMHTSLAECTPLQPNASHFSWMHTDYVQCILKIFVVWFHNCSHKACFFKTSERHILKSSVRLNCTVHTAQFLYNSIVTTYMYYCAVNTAHISASYLCKCKSFHNITLKNYWVDFAVGRIQPKAGKWVCITSCSASTPRRASNVAPKMLSMQLSREC